MEESVSNSIDNTNVSKSAKDPLTLSTNYSTRLFSNSTCTLSNEEIESRRSGFEKFITSLPKVCSPTICGLLNYRTPNSKVYALVHSSNEEASNRELDQSLNHESNHESNQTSSLNRVNNKSKSDRSNNKTDDTSGYQTLSCKVDNSTKSNCDKAIDSTSCKLIKDCDNQFKNAFEKKQPNDKSKDLIKEENEINEFDWSIDQIALLNPCDITFDDDNFLLYKEFEEHNKSLMLKQNEDFFKQNVIVPSPAVNTPILARKRQLMYNNICKTSSPFIDYLNAKQNNTSSVMFKTPLQLSDIREASGPSNLPDDHLSFKTPLQHTPINDQVQSIKFDEKALPKKKLFHKFDSSSCSSKKANLLNSISSLNSINKNKHYSDISPALSDLSQFNNQFNCTELDLDCKNFSLDISEIGNGINLNESNDHSHIKSSTNRKGLNRLFKEDCLNCLLEEDENEIKKLDLNDTDELNEVDLNDELDNKNDELDNKNEIDKNEFNNDKDEFNNEKDEFNDDKNRETSEQINNVEDVRMSISMQHNADNHSLMDCSFETIETKEFNQLSNEPIEQPESNDHVSFMETSSIQCSLNSNNFNKIDPKYPNYKNQSHQQLTSTPFRF